MAGERIAWIRRVKAVEAEYGAARIAADRLVAALAVDADHLSQQVKLKSATEMQERVEWTYLIRAYATFENALRAAWRDVYGKARKNTKAMHLVNTIASKARIDGDVVTKVHAVRDYRNDRIHDDATAVPAVSLADARSCMCTFLSRLPPDW